MFNRLERLYHEGRINVDSLANAVSRNWITQDEADIITGAKKAGEDQTQR